MAETHTPERANSAPHQKAPRDEPQRDQKSPGATQRASEDARQAAEAVGQAGQEAVGASRAILETNVKTTQEAVRSTIEASTQAFDIMSEAMTRTFGASTDQQLANESSENVRAVSQAATSLARGAQEASQAWLEVFKDTTRTNLEALSNLAGCRTLQDVVALQSNLARDNLQRLIDGGETIARSATTATEEAKRAMQSRRDAAASK